MFEFSITKQFGSCSFKESTLHIKNQQMSFSYACILIIKKTKYGFWEKVTKQNTFPQEIHYYILTHVDNNYLSPKACRNNIGALEIKSLSLLCMHLAEACKFI